MIKVPFAVWLVLFLSLWVGWFFYLWVRDYLKDKGQDTRNRSSSRTKTVKCPYCNAISEKKGKGPQRCGVCGSWI